MKFNISFPQNGTQKCVELDDDAKCRPFYDKRMGAEVEADSLGDEFKGYIVKISGGNDKDGFPMKQGIIINGRTRVLMSKGHSCYRPRRTGERKRKTVRGCIVGPDIRVLSLVIVKKGEGEVDGLTNQVKEKRLGPKRASKLRKLLNIPRGKDANILVRKVAIRRTWEKNGKKHQKAPKIQRLITEERLRRKAIYKKEKKDRWLNTRKAQEEYAKLLSEWRKKKDAKRSAEIAKRRSSEEKGKKPETTAPKAAAPKTTAAKTAPAAAGGAAKTAANTGKTVPPKTTADQQKKAPATTAPAQGQKKVGK